MWIAAKRTPGALYPARCMALPLQVIPQHPTGIQLSPTGLSYQMGSASTGSDTFQVSVTDGTYSDTTTIYVTIIYPAHAGTITGIDSICPGDTVTFADTASGGVWSAGNTAVSTITSTGQITGLAPGTTNIMYSVTNLCGTVTASFPVIVRSDCPNTTIVNQYTGLAPGKISIYPNPGYGTFTAQLQSDNQEEVHFTITNIVGETIKEFTAVTNKPQTYNLPNQPVFISFQPLLLMAHGQRNWYW